MMSGALGGQERRKRKETQARQGRLQQEEIALAKKKAKRKISTGRAILQGRPEGNGTGVDVGPPASAPKPAKTTPEAGTSPGPGGTPRKPDWRALIFPAVLMVLSLTILIRGPFVGKTPQTQASAGGAPNTAVPLNLTLPEEGIQTLPPAVWLSALKKAGASNSVILDVRTPGEVASGKIALEGYEFLNLDYYDPAFDQQLNRLDKEKTYFVYCSTGYRSGQVIQRMKTLGFKRAFSLSGGITEFRRSGLSANP